MRKRPRSSVTTVFAYLVGRSVVSAITQTPASGPPGPVTTPPRSLPPTVTPESEVIVPAAHATSNAMTPRRTSPVLFAARFMTSSQNSWNDAFLPVVVEQADKHLSGVERFVETGLPRFRSDMMSYSGPKTKSPWDQIAACSYGVASCFFTMRSQLPAF